MSNSLAQPLEAFQQGVDNLLAKRSYFISQVLPSFTANQDYYEVKGKKSLSKGGAEKLASIHNLSAVFQRDDETMSAFSLKDMIAYVCTLYRGEQTVGQGRGCSTLSKNQGDANKTVKMAQKSSFIDAVIRSTGLSDIFTADLEDMATSQVFSRPFYEDKTLRGHNTQVETETALQQEPGALNDPFMAEETERFGFIQATDKQRNYLHRLISQRYFEPEEMEERLNVIESLSKSEASQMIEELLNI